MNLPKKTAEMLLGELKLAMRGVEQHLFLLGPGTAKAMRAKLEAIQRLYDEEAEMLMQINMRNMGAMARVALKDKSNG